MAKKSQIDLSFRKFLINGISLVIFFLLFLGVSFSPIARQDIESKNLEIPTTQIATPNSNRIPENGFDLFVEQIEEKEEEKQEEELVDFSLDTIWPSFGCEWFVNSVSPKTSFGTNSRSYSHIPFYILFQNLKLDLV